MGVIQEVNCHRHSAEVSSQHVIAALCDYPSRKVPGDYLQHLYDQTSPRP